MITSFPICLANSCIVSLHHIISFSSMESLCFSSRPLTFQVPKRNCFLKPKILPVTCFSWDAWLPASPWPVANFSPLVVETSGRPVATRIAKHSRLKLQCLSYGLVGIVNVVVSPRFIHRSIFNLSGYIRMVTSLHLCFSLRYWWLPLPSTRIQKFREFLFRQSQSHAIGLDQTGKNQGQAHRQHSRRIISRSGVLKLFLYGPQTRFSHGVARRKQKLFRGGQGKPKT